MNLFRTVGLVSVASGILLMSGCASTTGGTANTGATTSTDGTYTAIPTPYQMDTFGTAISTFADENMVKKGVFYYPEYVPYSLKTPTNHFTYLNTNFKTYVTPDGVPNSLMLDSANESLLVAQIDTASEKVTTTDQLSTLDQTKLYDILAKLSHKYDMTAGVLKKGTSANVVQYQDHPYLSQRYAVISTDRKRTVSEIRNEIMALVYDKPVLPQNGLDSKILQKTFYIDVTTWSDMVDPSKIHAAFFIHGVTAQTHARESEWQAERKWYLDATNFIQY